MIVADKVVVDGFWDVHRAQGIADLMRLLADDAHCVGGIVAADIVELGDLVRLENLEYLVAIFQVGLVARRAQRGRRRRRDSLEVGVGFLTEVDEVLVDDAPHAVRGAIDGADVAESPRLLDDADQRLVDHRGRPAPLSDEDFLQRHEISPLSWTSSACRAKAVEQV